MLNFKVIFNETDLSFKANLHEDNLSFEAKFGEVLRYEVLQEGLDAYEGEYEITPTVKGRTLETAKKFVEADIVIKEIPYFDVGNTSGGSTVYIANELD